MSWLDDAEARDPAYQIGGWGQGAIVEEITQSLLDADEGPLTVPIQKLDLATGHR